MIAGYLVVPLLLGLVGAAAAQPPEPPASNRPTVDAVRVDAGTLRVDGILDEPAWALAMPATGFRQRDPDNGAPATERTDVRILFDDTQLVIGVTLHDSQPDKVLANQLQRDQPFSADDRFMLTIDTFLDGRNGYYFEVNPAGAMGDGLITGGSFNKSWDGIWTARVRRTRDGWVASIAIPFATLNFDPDAPAWGINFQRTIRRKNEEDLWTGFARNQGLMQMTNAGRLVGIRDVSQGLGLDIVPYGLGTLTSASGLGRDRHVGDGAAGLDLFYNLTPALRANLSVNTDFAETEVDQRQVNLTRFPLFFEEKRNFFLEGASFFEFSGGSGRVVPFFSRRMGLGDDGHPQRIDVGAKLTGQAGDYDVGLLQVRTADADAAPGEDFTVARVRRRMWRESHVGGLYTRRAARDGSVETRQTLGADVALHTSSFRGDRKLQFDGYYVQTTGKADVDAGGAAGARLTYPNDPVTAELALRWVDDSYSPAVGFVTRRGLWEVRPSGSYTLYVDTPIVRYFRFSGEAEFINAPDGRPLARDHRVQPIDVNFADGSRIGFEIMPQYERFDRPFEIARGVVVPGGGAYGYTRYRLSGATAEQRLLSLSGSVETGDFLSGIRRQYVTSLNVRPRRGVRVSLDGERNDVDLVEGSFVTNVYRVGVDTQFSPWLSLAQNLQYDSVSSMLGWQLRFRWIERPGNNLYFVYSHDWEEVVDFDRRRFETSGTRAATKLVYTFRF